MWETLVIYLGQEIIRRGLDRMWSNKTPNQQDKFVLDPSGQLHIADSRNGRTFIPQSSFRTQQRRTETVFGDFYIPLSVNNLLDGDEITLMMIIDEINQQPLIFEADLNQGYQVELPHSDYSFLAFLLDPDADSLYDALVYAVGLPSIADLTQIEEFYTDQHDDIFSFVTMDPLGVYGGGPYYLDFIMIDTDYVPEFPPFFGQFFETDASIAGTWRIDDVHEFGTAIIELHLQQEGNMVAGYALVHEFMNDGTQMLVREEVVGQIEDGYLSLAATDYQILQGQAIGWVLDNWYGAIESDNVIRGYSEDDAGVQGNFLMQRIA
jgi:hypothetical protein